MAWDAEARRDTRQGPIRVEAGLIQCSGEFVTQTPPSLESSLTEFSTPQSRWLVHAIPLVCSMGLHSGATLICTESDASPRGDVCHLASPSLTLNHGPTTHQPSFELLNPIGQSMLFPWYAACDSTQGPPKSVLSLVNHRLELVAIWLNLA